MGTSRRWAGSRDATTLRASTRAFLDEIRATGCDLRLSRFDGSDLSAWEITHIGHEMEMASVGGVTCHQITKGQPWAGFELPFDLVKNRVPHLPV